MHIAMAINLLFSIWGNWKNIFDHVIVLWYVRNMQLMYQIVLDDYWLWRLNPSRLSTKELAILHSFLASPAATFLYVSI